MLRIHAKFLIVSEEWLFMGTNYITLVPWMVQVIPRSQNSKKKFQVGVETFAWEPVGSCF